MARDYEQERRRADQIAWSLGYEDANERRRVKGADSPETLKRNLEPILQQLADQGDYQSMGLIYRDLYDSWDMIGWTLGDLWEDMEY